MSASTLARRHRGLRAALPSCAVAVGLVALAGARTSAAQQVLRPAVIAGPGADGPRVRFGVGGWAAAGWMTFTAGGALGLQLRLGVQANDIVAAYVQASVTTVGVTTIGSAAAMVDFTVADIVTFGTGFAYAGAVYTDLCSYQQSCAIGAPFRIALNRSRRGPRGRTRHALSLAVDGFLGAPLYSTRWTQSVVGYAGLMLGYERM